MSSKQHIVTPNQNLRDMIDELISSAGSLNELHKTDETILSADEVSEYMRQFYAIRNLIQTIEIGSYIHFKKSINDKGEYNNG